MSKKELTNKSSRAANAGEKELLFGKENYLIMLAGLAVIALGFVLMYGKEDIFSATKITVAPLLVLLGFVIEVFAIFRKPKEKAGNGDA